MTNRYRPIPNFLLNFSKELRHGPLLGMAYCPQILAYLALVGLWILFNWRD